LTPTWDPGKFTEIEADRTTIEDVEHAVDKALPAGEVEFLPASVMESKLLTDFFNLVPTPYAGVHPNCESMSLLVSNGTSYIPLSVYLKKSIFEVKKDLRKKEKLILKKLNSINNNRIGSILESIGIKKSVNNIIVFVSLGDIFFRSTKIDKILGASGFDAATKVLKILGKIVLGHKPKEVLRQYTKIHNVLPIMVIPFEDNECLESARLERCAAAFTYFEPEEDKVKTIPVCAWGLHKNKALAKVTEYYGSGGNK
jgi:hypothetical protein